MRRAVLTALSAVSAASLMLAACGSDSNDSSSTEAATTAPGGTEAAATTTAVADAAACAKGKTLEDGTLTVATGNPAFAPWVIDDKPESGQGFESAVAYAVAEKMGFDQSHVKWVRTGFDEAIQPGKKNFDFNIQQYTITPEREKTVSFSEPYYTTNQALVDVRRLQVRDRQDRRRPEVGQARRRHRHDEPLVHQRRDQAVECGLRVRHQRGRQGRARSEADRRHRRRPADVVRHRLRRD